ncbi:unnamed protein product [Rangifer tarandus platyrhynchus]|uniref:Uncharacterized protein n=1 Tax=Rangifer tarandus platyrhynchus TaxID=3082113 RepID=A0AC59YWZ9_RANTA
MKNKGGRKGHDRGAGTPPRSEPPWAWSRAGRSAATPPHPASAVTHCRRSGSLSRSRRLGHLLARRGALTSLSHAADSGVAARTLRPRPRSALRPAPGPAAPTLPRPSPPWPGPGTKSGAAFCPNRGLRAAAERPLALRKEPSRDRRRRQQESGAAAGGGGGREPQQQETCRQKLGAPRRALSWPGMGPSAARPPTGPPGRD